MRYRSRSRAPLAFAACVALVTLAACSGSDGPADPVPLSDAVATLEPKAVWEHFQALTQIPRTSHHEAAVSAHVASIGNDLGLETVVDEVGNVVIREPATAGREGRPIVVLQAHLDMVGVDVDGSFDFLTQPIDAWVLNGWVDAGNTTLGADAGIGVAMILAVLQSPDAVHGPIEAVFTVDEEDGMDGINGLSPDALQGRLYLNLDNENEGQFVIGSAGAVDVMASATYAEEPPADGTSGQQVTVDGLIGGHSGIDIDEGRASAHQLLADLLVNAPAELDVRVASLDGGDQLNAIPRRATARVAVPAGQVAAFGTYVQGFAAAAAAEYATAEPDLAITATAAEVPALVMAPSAQAALLGAVLDVPQGVAAMSPDIEGLVETSGNLGILNVAAGQFAAGAKVRSATDAERDAEAQRWVDVLEAGGATALLEDAYSAWAPDLSSPLLALMQQVYVDTFHASPEVTAIHAGLETGVAGVKYPGMDMISVGPTTEYVHSPDERLEVASVPKAYELLLATLAAIE